MKLLISINVQRTGEMVLGDSISVAVWNTGRVFETLAAYQINAVAQW
jgi:hypothetical protein